MLTNIAKKIFGSRNDRLLKQYRKSVAGINALEEQMQALSDADLQAKTAEFKQRLADGQTLDGILPEAFAVCREASRRTSVCATSTCSLSAVWCCTTAKSPKCVPAKAKPWSPPSPSISTRWLAKACTSLPSTTTSPRATQALWSRSTISSA